MTTPKPCPVCAEFYKYGVWVQIDCNLCKNTGVIAVEKPKPCPDMPEEVTEDVLISNWKNDYSHKGFSLGMYIIHLLKNSPHGIKILLDGETK